MNKKILLMVVASLIGLGWVAAGPSDPYQDDVREAWAIVQQFVKKRLKSPSSADFPPEGHRHVIPIDGNSYQVDSYVDAQNAFGVMIRTPFVGEVVRRMDGGWRLESLRIGAL